MSDDYTTAEGEPVDPETGEIQPPQSAEPPAALEGWSIEVERAAVARYREIGRLFDLDAALDAAGRKHRKQDQALEAWWAWCMEFRAAAFEEVRARTEFEREEGTIVFRLRQQGERSADVARMRALAEYDDLFVAKLGYRFAEARKIAADKNMRRLSAMLDDLRTQEANNRAMHEHSNWTQTT